MSQRRPYSGGQRVTLLRTERIEERQELHGRQAYQMVNDRTTPIGSHTPVHSRGMSEHLIRLERLTQYRDSKGWTDAELSRQMDRKPAQLGAWRKGSRTISEKIARAVEETLGLPRYYLEEGGAAPRPFIVRDAVHELREPSAPGYFPPAFQRLVGATQSVKTPTSVPVLGRHDLARMNEKNSSGAVRKLETYPARGAVSERAKAFVVDDDSMTPDLLPGDLLVLDPEASPRPGDIAMVRTPAGDYLLRRLVYRTASVFEAAPANLAGYRPLRSDADGIVVVAVMIEHTRLRAP